MKPPLHILLVEDEGIIRLDMALSLSEMGHSVVEAPDAAHAISLLPFSDQQAFDLLITDIDMPGAMNGLALSHHVHQYLPHCHIMVVSGGQQPTMAEMPAKADFLSKPVSGSTLSKVLGRLDPA